MIVMDDGKVLTEGTPKEVFPRVDLLREHSLDVPQATELSYELNKRGVKLPLDILNEEECAKALLELLNGRE